MSKVNRGCTCPKLIEAKVNRGCTCPKLILKAPITTAADKVFFLLFFFFFQRKQILTFHVNCLLEKSLDISCELSDQADDSHVFSENKSDNSQELSIFVFSENMY